jgi:hypothetical protein
MPILKKAENKAPRDMVFRACCADPGGEDEPPTEDSAKESFPFHFEGN